jgi:ankyrin repeat protein
MTFCALSKRKGIDIKMKRLFSAAKKGNINKVKKFLDKGKDVNITDINGYTLLHVAAMEGHVDIVKYLIANKIDIDKLDNNGCSAFVIACGQGFYEIIKILWESGCSLYINEIKPLHLAAARGQNDIIELLINIGFDINKKDNGDGVGYTPIHWAVKENKLSTVELLHKNGANLEILEEDGFTPLSIAAAEGYIKIVNYFVKNNVDVDKTEDCTPLCMASVYGYDEIVNLLIKSGAEVDYVDNDGKTSLYYAIINNNINIVKLLINEKANLNKVIISKSEYKKIKKDIKELLATHGYDMAMKKHIRKR